MAPSATTSNSAESPANTSCVAGCLVIDITGLTPSSTTLEDDLLPIEVAESHLYIYPFIDMDKSAKTNSVEVCPCRASHEFPPSLDTIHWRVWYWLMAFVTAKLTVSPSRAFMLSGETTGVGNTPSCITGDVTVKYPFVISQ